jgi:hypothetical protein
MEGKQSITGITEDGLSKMINPEAHFKYSNWEQWLENERLKIEKEKMQLRHQRFLIIASVTAIGIIIGGLIYCGNSGLMTKEVLTGLLGTVTGAGLTIFKKFAPKSEND